MADANVNTNTNVNTEGNPTTDPNQTPTTPTPQTTGKTFSEDYVHTLREESKGYRLTAKSYETALKKLLGVNNLDDVDNQIATFTAAQQKALDEANAKTTAFIINAELERALAGEYNEKLAKKLVDLSKVKVEDGKVSGIKEALEAAAKEYPEIKKKTPKTADGTGSSQTGTEPEDENVKKFRAVLGLKT